MHGGWWNLLCKANAAGYLLIVLLIMAVLTAALGVTPMFGALMAGIVTSQAAEEHRQGALDLRRRAAGRRAARQRH
jgi:hypothetical protein